MGARVAAVEVDRTALGALVCDEMWVVAQHEIVDDRDLLGHESVETTRRYLRSSLDELQAAVEGVM